MDAKQHRLVKEEMLALWKDLVNYPAGKFDRGDLDYFNSLTLGCLRSVIFAIMGTDGQQALRDAVVKVEARKGVKHDAYAQLCVDFKLPVLLHLIKLTKDKYVWQRPSRRANAQVKSSWRR